MQVSSIGGRGATPGLGAYQSAKWAVNGFSGVLAKEVGPLGIRVTVLEPGGMRTDWAGSSMRIDPLRPDYEPTVGASAHMHGAGPEVTRSDPEKVAEVMLRLAAMDEPPLRLLLGSDAVFLAERFAAARADEDAQWRGLSLSTDFDGLPPFSESSAARLLAPVQR
jgi:NAD(P)-dependent dehydrogenase (short-subunit alcohol dehydrogenase family)